MTINFLLVICGSTRFLYVDATHLGLFFCLALTCRKKKVATLLISLLASRHYSSQGSRDGYFEMSLDESVKENVCSPSISLALPPANDLSGHQGELCAKEEAEEEDEEEEAEEEDVKVCRVLWCYCLQVEEEVEQKEACVVLCDQLVGLLFLPGDFTWTGELKVKPAKVNRAGPSTFVFYLLRYKRHNKRTINNIFPMQREKNTSEKSMPSEKTTVPVLPYLELKFDACQCHDYTIL